MAIRGARNRASGAVGGAYRRSRRFFIDTENTNIVLGLVAVVVVASLAVPTLFPELKRSGPACTNLSSPPGGNRRSILAENDSQQDLALEVDIDAPLSNDAGDPMIRLSETLTVDVVFKNEDIGALILYLRDGYEAIGPAPSLEAVNTIGLYLEIIPVGGTQSVTDPDPNRRGLPSITSFNEQQDLHVLQARRRCVMEIVFSPQRLASMGITAPGEYAIRAHYRNLSIGEAIIPSDATATPMFLTNGVPDQGVWTGRVTSREVRFEISP